MEQITIEKHSATEYRRIRTIPQVVIPEAVEDVVIPLSDTKKELEKATSELDRLQQAKQFDVERYETALARHDELIAKAQEAVDALTSEITDAEAQGVKEIIEEPRVEVPAELPINEGEIL